MKKYIVTLLILTTFASIWGYKKYERYAAIKAAASCVAECYTKFEKFLIQENTLESDMIMLRPKVLDACCKHCGVEVR